MVERARDIAGIFADAGSASWRVPSRLDRLGERASTRSHAMDEAQRQIVLQTEQSAAKLTQQVGQFAAR